jgi:hypothetical protein
MSKISNYARTVNPSKISEFVKDTKNMVNEVETMLENTPIQDQNMAVAKIFSQYGLI